MLRRTLTLGLAPGSTALAARVSTQQELGLGRQYAAEINEQFPSVEPAAIHGYSNDLGNRIQQQPGTRDIPNTFYVVNVDQVNAFAIAGGYVYLNRGFNERSESLAELEADSVGVRRVRDAGIDPHGVTSFFQKLLDDRERSPSLLEQWSSTHPLTEERIQRVRALADALPPFEPTNVGAAGYDDFKARIQHLPSPPEEFRQP
ncbi:MAG: M48 family metalloprotease [Longimicrobiales bacterium]